jgi:hypothetical protein
MKWITEVGLSLLSCTKITMMAHPFFEGPAGIATQLDESRSDNKNKVFWFSPIIRYPSNIGAFF